LDRAAGEVVDGVVQAIEGAAGVPSALAVLEPDLQTDEQEEDRDGERDGVEALLTHGWLMTAKGC
jgi:hypothetical protein